MLIWPLTPCTNQLQQTLAWWSPTMMMGIRAKTGKLSDVSGNPRKGVREAGREIYAGIAVPAELLEALPSKPFASEAEVRLKDLDQELNGVSRI
jgi:hypothetical protein